MTHRPIHRDGRVQINRRTVLRGVGAAMALPLLEAMTPLARLAQAAADPLGASGVAGGSQAVPRLCYIFFPNGVHYEDWKPIGSGRDYTLSPLLEPLARHRDDMLIISGLAHHNAKALGDGPGDHARSAACFLTGAHPVKTAGADIEAGVSVDQVAARALEGRTRFASLELGCEPAMQSGNCDSGYSCAYSSNISWRTPNTPNLKEINPRLVFERLFMLGDENESPQHRTERIARRRSILDYVRDDARKLERKLGDRDRRKLEEYFDSVRAIETRVEQAERLRDDPDAIAGFPRPTGTPRDYREHLDLMADLMVLALRLDLTRVCTFMIANEGSNRPFPFLNIADGHHHLSHHGGDGGMVEKIRQINRFQSEAFARVLDKFKQVKDETDPEGASLLDSTMIVWGGAISDGNRHNHDQLPVIVAGGRRCGVELGEHRVLKHETPMCNLHLGMLRRMGLDTPSFGDSNGVL
ncbi:MAG: DUF1552 domain-containing protein [Phycisphaeraceae bacterium]|nr:MAG: DUF1552 domain-containing protein [Phycisphaeraceae bacterium]